MVEKLEPPEKWAHLRWHWITPYDARDKPIVATWHGREGSEWQIGFEFWDARVLLGNGWRYHKPADPTAITLDPPDASLITSLTSTIYNHPMPDGDHLSVLIHCSDYIPDDVPLPDQLARVREICEGIARGVVDAILKGRAG